MSPARTCRRGSLDAGGGSHPAFRRRGGVRRGRAVGGPVVLDAELPRGRLRRLVPVFGWETGELRQGARPPGTRRHGGGGRAGRAAASGGTRHARAHGRPPAIWPGCSTSAERSRSWPASAPAPWSMRQRGCSPAGPRRRTGRCSTVWPRSTPPSTCGPRPFGGSGRAPTVAIPVREDCLSAGCRPGTGGVMLRRSRAWHSGVALLPAWRLCCQQLPVPPRVAHKGLPARARHRLCPWRGTRAPSKRPSSAPRFLCRSTMPSRTGPRWTWRSSEPPSDPAGRGWARWWSTSAARAARLGCDLRSDPGTPQGAAVVDEPLCAGWRAAPRPVEPAAGRDAPPILVVGATGDRPPPTAGASGSHSRCGRPPCSPTTAWVTRCSGGSWATARTAPTSGSTGI
jgi:hypothetical protein